MDVGGTVFATSVKARAAQIFLAAGGSNPDTLTALIAQQRQVDRDTGFATPPELAIEIGEIADGHIVDGNDNVALCNAGKVTRCAVGDIHHGHAVL